MKSLKIILGLFILIILNVSAAYAQNQFTHTVTAANKYCNATCSLTNISDPFAILIVSPVLVNGTNRNPHPIGVYYVPFLKKWSIINVDGVALTEGVKFNVQYYLNPDPNQFVFIVNQQGGTPCIDHAGLNANPNAQVLFSPTGSPRGAYFNRHEAKIEYDAAARQWCIVNTNNQPVNAQTAFNIVVSPGPTVGSIPTTPPPSTPTATTSTTTTPATPPPSTPTATTSTTTTPTTPPPAFKIVTGVEYTAPNTWHTFTVPAGVTQLSFEMWGGGGGGGSGRAEECYYVSVWGIRKLIGPLGIGGGGGGGGAHISGTVSVVPGTLYGIYIGSGGVAGGGDGGNTLITNGIGGTAVFTAAGGKGGGGSNGANAPGGAGGVGLNSPTDRSGVGGGTGSVGKAGSGGSGLESLSVPKFSKGGGGQGGPGISTYIYPTSVWINPCPPAYNTPGAPGAPGYVTLHW